MENQSSDALTCAQADFGKALLRFSEGSGNQLRVARFFYGPQKRVWNGYAIKFERLFVSLNRSPIGSAT
jgi:hypothetical protein